MGSNADIRTPQLTVLCNCKVMKDVDLDIACRYVSVDTSFRKRGMFGYLIALILPRHVDLNLCRKLSSRSARENLS